MNALVSFVTRKHHRGLRRSNSPHPAVAVRRSVGNGNVDVFAASGMSRRMTRRGVTYTRPMYASYPRRARGIAQAAPRTSLFRVV